MEKIIPVNTPIIRKQDIVNVAKTLKKGWVSSNGPEVLKFEDAFAKFLNLIKKNLKESNFLQTKTFHSRLELCLIQLNTKLFLIIIKLLKK